MQTRPCVGCGRTSASQLTLFLQKQLLTHKLSPAPPPPSEFFEINLGSSTALPLTPCHAHLQTHSTVNARSALLTLLALCRVLRVLAVCCYASSCAAGGDDLLRSCHKCFGKCNLVHVNNTNTLSGSIASVSLRVVSGTGHDYFSCFDQRRTFWGQGIQIIVFAPTGTGHNNTLDILR